MESKKENMSDAELDQYNKWLQEDIQRQRAIVLRKQAEKANLEKSIADLRKKEEERESKHGHSSGGGGQGGQGPSNSAS